MVAPAHSCGLLTAPRKETLKELSEKEGKEERNDKQHYEEGKKGQKLSRERFFFLKESDLRHKKAILNVNIKRLQNLVAKSRGNKRKEYSRELRNNRHKRRELTREACHRISRKVALIAENYRKKGFEVSLAIGKLKGLRNSTRKGDGKGRKFRGMINRFPFHLLTQFITYKAQELGITRVAEIKEPWTSRVCHKCGSTKTERPTQAQFLCLNCGLSYNADANGAINIALRFMQKISGSQRLLLKGFCEQPYRNESAPKAEEAGSFLKF